MISIYNPESPAKIRISDILKLKRSPKLFPNTVQIFYGINYKLVTWILSSLKARRIPSLSVIRINVRSLLRLYERIKIAVTAPMYTARFFPGSRFPDVLREITSDFWINQSSCLSCSNSKSTKMFFYRMK